MTTNCGNCFCWDVPNSECVCPCHKTELEKHAIRGEIEKVLWKHYDPDIAMNMEEVCDDIMPILTSYRQTIYKELIDAIEGAKVVCDQPAWACNECPTFNKGLKSAAQIIKQKQDE